MNSAFFLGLIAFFASASVGLANEAAVAIDSRYSAFLREASELGVSVNWVDDVAKSSGIPLGRNEELEGYFDPNQNAIYLSNALATIATLAHELRHAMHLGTKHGIVGVGFDRELQVLRLRSIDFDKNIDEMKNLSDAAKNKIHELIEDMILKASELSAHYRDLIILKETTNAKEAYEGSLAYRRQYHAEFINDYFGLQWYRALRAETLPGDLLRAAEAYYVVTAQDLPLKSSR